MVAMSVGAEEGPSARPSAGPLPTPAADGQAAREPGAACAAARAAAAGAGHQRRRAAGRPPRRRGASPWSDGSPTEEAPYDPEYDGPARPDRKAPGYEGFDPGDEPLDDVIDEKTARQSSEQQAVQLLREAFGAEKIGEA